MVERGGERDDRDTARQGDQPGAFSSGAQGGALGYWGLNLWGAESSASRLFALTRIGGAAGGEGRGCLCGRRRGAVSEVAGERSRYERSGQAHESGCAAGAVALQAHRNPVAGGKTGDNEEAERPGEFGVEVDRVREPVVVARQVRLGDPETEVLDAHLEAVEQVAPVNCDQGVGRGERRCVLDQLGQKVGDIRYGMAYDGDLVGDADVDTGVVLDLGHGAAHDFGRGQRIVPATARLVSRQHQKTFGIAAHARGEVVEPEEVGERIRVVLLLLEGVDER